MRLQFLLLSVLLFAAACSAQSSQQLALATLFAKYARSLCQLPILSFIRIRPPLIAHVCSTHGESWTNNSYWIVSENYCNWFGVTCDAYGNITKVPFLLLILPLVLSFHSISFLVDLAVEQP